MLHKVKADSKWLVLLTDGADSFAADAPTEEAKGGFTNGEQVRVSAMDTASSRHGGREGERTYGHAQLLNLAAIGVGEENFEPLQELAAVPSARAAPCTPGALLSSLLGGCPAASCVRAFAAADYRRAVVPKARLRGQGAELVSWFSE